MSSHRLLPALLATLLLPLLAPGARAEVPREVRSPRATLRTFLNALDVVEAKDAVACMDLSGLPERNREEEGERRAWQLARVLRLAKGRIESLLLTIPGHGDLEQGETVHRLLSHESGDVEIVRLDDGRWLFSAETVAAVPALLEAHLEAERSEEMQEIPEYARELPSWMREEAFLLEAWQWLGLFVVILLGVVGDRLLVWVLVLMVTFRLRRQGIETDRKLRRGAVRPLGLLAMAVIWWIGLPYIALPETAHEVLLIAAKGIAALAAVWSAYRVVDLVMDYFRAKAEQTETRIDDVLVPLLRKALKVFIAAFGIVFIADNLNVRITGLLAGLGLGGLAFALAARETVANLFGSVTVLLDRPFDIGDWIQVGKVDGNVERIGFRSTRVRTFYNSQITVPNSTLITAVVDNLGARRYRRIKTMLSLTYDTPPERIEAFCEGVRELIRRHPYTRKDYYHVYLNALSASSLDVLLYCFVETPDWATELREKHRLFADILRLARRVGVSFAFPTQTLWLEKAEPGEDLPEASRDDITDHRHQGRAAASEIVREMLPGTDKPPPVILGAQPLDPDLEERNVGGEEG
jgi:MscS family membrane protein